MELSSQQLPSSHMRGSEEREMDREKKDDECSWWLTWNRGGFGHSEAPSPSSPSALPTCWCDPASLLWRLSPSRTDGHSQPRLWSCFGKLPSPPQTGRRISCASPSLCPSETQALHGWPPKKQQKKQNKNNPDYPLMLCRWILHFKGITTIQITLWCCLHETCSTKFWNGNKNNADHAMMLCRWETCNVDGTTKFRIALLPEKLPNLQELQRFLPPALIACASTLGHHRRP